MHRADGYFAGGKFDQAKVEYLNLLRLDPANPVTYARLGAIWLDEGAPLRAAPFLLKTKELAPDDLASRLKLSRTLNALGRRGDGFTEAMYVLDKNPNDSEAARVAAEAAHTPEEIERVKQALDRMADHNSASFQLASAAVAARRGDSETVKSSVQRALELDPKSAPAHSAMGTLWLLQKQPAKAGDEFKTASELSQPRSLERLRYAQFQIQTGATDPAWNTLRESITQAPDFISAWLLLAELSLGKKNYDETLKLLANVLNRDPENIDGTILEARARMGKGEVDKGIQGLERLDGRYPNFPPLKCELAR
ncbi:MAG: tetratricopeptide repeat protein, partial [Chthoniobacterales bacterium]